MLPINNPALASKYATQIMNKLAGEAKRLAPWAAPAAILGTSIASTCGDMGVGCLPACPCVVRRPVVDRFD